ncbi:unnamed protein product [Chrysoparadoxa australica]
MIEEAKESIAKEATTEGRASKPAAGAFIDQNDDHQALDEFDWSDESEIDIEVLTAELEAAAAANSSGYEYEDGSDEGTLPGVTEERGTEHKRPFLEEESVDFDHQKLDWATPSRLPRSVANMEKPLVPEHDLLPPIPRKRFKARSSRYRGEGVTVFMVSALKGTGVNAVKQHLLKRADKRETPWLVEPGQTSTLTLEERVREIIREKLFVMLNKEVPYKVSLRRTTMRRDSDREKVYIEQEVCVPNENHKRMILSHKKTIGKGSANDLERLFGGGRHVGVQVHLDVKVVKKVQEEVH